MKRQTINNQTGIYARKKACSEVEGVDKGWKEFSPFARIQKKDDEADCYQETLNICNNIKVMLSLVEVNEMRQHSCQEGASVSPIGYHSRNWRYKRNDD